MPDNYISNKKIYWFVKRLFDIFFSIMIILVLFPILVFICILIKIDSKGSIFFKQLRVGKKGKFFSIYKFRTMVSNADQIGPILTEKKDFRITPFGKVLRRTSLDEIPNLINVLKGEMSVIGPRPDVIEIVSGYNKWQKLVLGINPGITGFSQVLGRQDLELETKLRYDRFYVKNEGLCIDLWIMLKTVKVILTGYGAR